MWRLLNQSRTPRLAVVHIQQQIIDPHCEYLEWCLEYFSELFNQSRWLPKPAISNFLTSSDRLMHCQINSVRRPLNKSEHRPVSNEIRLTRRVHPAARLLIQLWLCSGHSPCWCQTWTWAVENFNKCFPSWSRWIQSQLASWAFNFQVLNVNHWGFSWIRLWPNLNQSWLAPECCCEGRTIIIGVCKDKQHCWDKHYCGYSRVVLKQQHLWRLCCFASWFNWEEAAIFAICFGCNERHINCINWHQSRRRNASGQALFQIGSTLKRLS